jgi:putative transcriptional regulator
VRRGSLAVLLILFLLAAILPHARPAAAQNAPRTKLQPGSFLVASRKMRDPRFAKSVILIVRYEEKGALGLIVNQPTEVLLADLLPNVEKLKDRDDRVYLGGPVAKNGMMFLMRSDAAPADTQRIFADVYVSSSRERFNEVIVQDEARFRSYVGYAGWAPGQLESELRRHDWHVLPGKADAVFSEHPDGIWKTLIEQTEFLFASAGEDAGQTTLAPHITRR